MAGIFPFIGIYIFPIKYAVSSLTNNYTNLFQELYKNLCMLKSLTLSVITKLVRIPYHVLNMFENSSNHCNVANGGNENRRDMRRLR